MHVNFGLLSALVPPVRGKRERYAVYASRGLQAMARWLALEAGLGIDAVRETARTSVAAGAPR
jgi:hypothetical protein